VPVQAASGSVVPDRGAEISMGGSFLDVAQWHPRIETGRERITNRVEYLSSQNGAMRLLSSSVLL
jgi:hypothetical protein